MATISSKKKKTKLNAESSSLHHTSSTYHCVECLTPSTTLYRQYTASVSSIKLTTCVKCGGKTNVDDYIEREWLLVLVDCLLLRLPAYRHVLLNRLRFDNVANNKDSQKRTNSHDTKNKHANQIRHGSDDLNWYMLVCISIMMDVWLKWQTLLVSTNTLNHHGSNDAESTRTTTTTIEDPIMPTITDTWMSDFILMFQLVMGSLLSSCSFWLGIVLPTKMILIWRRKKRNHSRSYGEPNKETRSLSTLESSSSSSSLVSFQLMQIRLGISIFMPTMFHVVTILVLVWEDSPLVQWLSSLFVLVLQYAAISTTLAGSFVVPQELEASRPLNPTESVTTQKGNIPTRRRPPEQQSTLLTLQIFLQFLVGVLCKACIPILMTTFVLPSTIAYPCTGLAVQVRPLISSLNNNWWNTSSSSLLEQHVLLCIA